MKCRIWRKLWGKIKKDKDCGCNSQPQTCDDVV